MSTPLGVKQAAGSVPDIPCNLCGANDYTTLYEAGVAQVNRIVRCRSCGLMYCTPRINGTDIDSIEHWDADYVYRQVKEQESHRVDKQTLQRRDYEETRRYFAELYPQRGFLVEVGASLGYLLDYFRQDGWKVLGVEPNRGFALYAERELGVTMIPSTLGEAGLEAGSVDVVTMMHVIEHVPDPSAVFREVHQVLKPGGLFVLETPRYDTLMFKVLGRRERSLSCDGHIYFFTSKTLAEMARRNGFEVLRATYVGRSLTLERLLHNVGVISKSQQMRKGLQRLSDRFRLNRATLHLNLRDMERVYLRKV
jgi:2-polyprenyl-3-methyl-5-hydroxy-6-metoxy-1,4-benzoquinol methylase